MKRFAFAAALVALTWLVSPAQAQYYYPNTGNFYQSQSFYQPSIVQAAAQTYFPSVSRYVSPYNGVSSNYYGGNYNYGNYSNSNRGYNNSGYATPYNNGGYGNFGRGTRRR